MKQRLSSSNSKRANSVRQSVLEFLDTYHRLKKAKEAKEGIKIRETFLVCLEKQRQCESGREETSTIYSIVKHNMHRFEPLSKNLDVEMRIFARKYQYYDGFEPAGTCRRRKIPLNFD